MKCRLSKNFYADDLTKMFGAGMDAQTVATELSDCNRRSQGCFIRYVVLPRQSREQQGGENAARFPARRQYRYVANEPTQYLATTGPLPTVPQ